MRLGISSLTRVLRPKPLEDREICLERATDHRLHPIQRATCAFLWRNSEIVKHFIIDAHECNVVRLLVLAEFWRCLRALGRSAGRDCCLSVLDRYANLFAEFGLVLGARALLQRLR